MKKMGFVSCVLVILILCPACRTGQQTPLQAAPRPVVEVSLPTQKRIIRDAEQAGLAPEQPVETQPTQEESSPIEIPRPETVRPEAKELITKDMVRIEGGKFTIGYIDAGCTDAGPVEGVTVETYWIDKYEVTNAQWKKFIESAGYEWKSKLSAWPLGAMPEELANHPVGYISWEDANAYAKWAGKRLPTEFEWEIAARGVDKRYYPWGNKFDEKKCNVKQSGIGTTTPVGTYKDSVSPYGCHDMCGNVAEWVQDWYKAYPGSEQSSPDFGEKYKVLRGGSFFSESGFRTYIRSKDDPTAWTNAYYGFRCAISDSEVQKQSGSKENK